LDTEKEKLRCQSYLPDGTSGLRLPNFTMSAKIPRTPQRGQSPQLRGRAISAPLKYHPFVILGNNDLEPNWQFSLYRDGEHIEPRDDFWLKECNWVKQRSGPWMNQTFTKTELCDIIFDIVSKFDRTTITKEDIARWIRPEPAPDITRSSFFF